MTSPVMASNCLLQTSAALARGQDNGPESNHPQTTWCFIPCRNAVSQSAHDYGVKLSDCYYLLPRATITGVWMMNVSWWFPLCICVTMGTSTSEVNTLSSQHKVFIPCLLFSHFLGQLLTLLQNSWVLPESKRMHCHFLWHNTNNG